MSKQETTPSDQQSAILAAQMRGVLAFIRETRARLDEIERRLTNVVPPTGGAR